jgi:hypothetical protein
MSQHQIDRVAKSRYGGYRLLIGDAWYTYHGDPSVIGDCPVVVDIDWIPGAKGGQLEVGSINGQAAAAPRQAAPATHPSPSPAPRASAPPAPAPAPVGTRDQWIIVSTILGHVIDARGSAFDLAELEALTKASVRSAILAHRMFAALASTDGPTAVAAAREAMRPAVRPAPAEEPPPDPWRETGPDFDDDVPF